MAGDKMNIITFDAGVGKAKENTGFELKGAVLLSAFTVISSLTVLLAVI
jgi:hypothetical protein